MDTQTITPTVLPAVTIETIRAAARAESDAHGNWLADDSKTPPPSYYDKLEAWLMQYDPIVLPIAFESMKRLRLAYEDYLHRSNAEVPQQEFWAARLQAQQDTFREPPPRRERPTPADMLSSGVKPRQIAWEWRILDADGQPDLDRVQQELDKPGTVITAKYLDWMHQQDLIQLGFLMPEGRDIRAAVEWNPQAEVMPAPEPIEKLIRQRLGLDQIVRIKAQELSIPDGEEGDEQRHYLLSGILQLSIAMGVELPENAQAIINEGGHRLAEQIMGQEIANAPISVPPVMPTDEALSVTGSSPEQPANANPSINSTTVQQVMQLFSEGFDVGEISKRVGISKSQARRIVTSQTEGQS